MRPACPDRAPLGSERVDRAPGMCIAGHVRVRSSQSIWKVLSAKPDLPRRVPDGLHVDVIVVGGGITGVTSALLLKDAGRSVAVVEARDIGSGVTSQTSAHLTQVLDTRYAELEHTFGPEGARLAAQSSGAAIDQIATLVARTGAECDFSRVPGYLYTTREEDVDQLKAELEAARRAGLSAELSRVPLPLVVRAGLCFPAQAELNPLSYLGALVQRIPGEGSYVFENTRVVAVDEGEPCRVHLEHGLVLTADRVILATHVPLNRVLLIPRVAQCRSYVVSGPAHQSAPGLFWDTERPYHYVRRQRVGTHHHWIVGGADHKTGETPALDPFVALSEYAVHVGLHEVQERWSAQVVASSDGLPLIGPNAMSERVYVATGFSGNGMTFGTLAAMLLRDACLDRDNPYAALYSTSRVKTLASLVSLIGEHVEFPLHLLSDSLKPPEARSLSEIAPGQAKTVRVAAQRLGVYRDGDFAFHAVSPVCTHLEACHVKFNPAERSWDCPCCGSRFGIDGRVLDGPAVRNLTYRRLRPEEHGGAPGSGLLTATRPSGK
jgi:glycine/D-amino acid oxidase-like deaminating enzyme/nitrite reductase/ring-hydroxylating ferredoxin subunit